MPRTDRLLRLFPAARTAAAARPTARFVLAAWPLALLLVAATPGAGLTGETTVIDDVPHVRSTAVPAHGVTAVTLDELWRAGGDNEDVFFGAVSRVLTGDDGNIYLLDSQLSQVSVFSAEGEYLRALGREGDGPGETRNPSDAFFLPDGRLGMVQTFPGKVVLVDRQGDPAGSFAYNAGDPSRGQFAVLVRGVTGGDNIVLGGIRMSFSPQSAVSEQTFFLARCTADGGEQRVYLTKQHQIDYSNLVMDERGMDFGWGRYDVGADGRVYVAPERNAYTIHVYSADGRLEKIIERSYESWPRDAEQLRQARLTLEAVGRNYPAPLRDVTVAETAADISSLWVTAGGEIWVETSRSGRDLPDGVLARLDVFDAQGDFDRQVDLRGSGDLERDAIVLLPGGRLVLVTGALDAYRSMQGVSDEQAATGGAESAPLEVICYRMSEG